MSLSSPLVPLPVRPWSHRMGVYSQFSLCRSLHSPPHRIQFFSSFCSFQQVQSRREPPESQSDVSRVRLCPGPVCCRPNQESPRRKATCSHTPRCLHAGRHTAPPRKTIHSKIQAEEVSSKIPLTSTRACLARLVPEWWCTLTRQAIHHVCNAPIFHPPYSSACRGGADGKCTYDVVLLFISIGASRGYWTAPSHRRGPAKRRKRSGR
jgi:hypothetical protein